MMQHKLLFLDIETFPTEAYVWGLWDQNVGLSQIKRAGGVVSWAACWQGSDDVEYSSIHMTTKEQMLREMWALLDEADVVCGWNSDAFDLRTLNAEFAVHGMGPPSPYKKIDLLKVVRRHMKFLSNKLDYVSGVLGVGHKLETGGFDLWLRCMEGDEEAWDLFHDYNIYDVILTEEVYDKLTPWLPQVLPPQHGMTCTCGSTHVHSKGTAKTAVSLYQRFQCQTCGAWLRSVIAEKRDRKSMLRKEAL